VATVPIIDARDYADLLDRALSRIPVHSPEWTNFQASDVGITLLELFAFVGEALVYTERDRRRRRRRRLAALVGGAAGAGAAVWWIRRPAS
jgi:hypothetical protein